MKYFKKVKQNCNTNLFVRDSKLLCGGLTRDLCGIFLRQHLRIDVLVGFSVAKTHELSTHGQNFPWMHFPAKLRAKKG